MYEYGDIQYGVLVDVCLQGSGLLWRILMVPFWDQKIESAPAFQRLAARDVDMNPLSIVSALTP